MNQYLSTRLVFSWNAFLHYRVLKIFAQIFESF